MSANRAIKFCWVAVAGAGGLLHAATPDGEPDYKSLRYEEDYSYLRLVHSVSDYVDPLKFIPLNQSGESFLTLGGEIRERYEYYRNPLWGQGIQDHDGYLLDRVMLFTDLHLGRNVRVFSQLKDDRVFGASAPRVTDEDRFDLSQAFLELGWSVIDENSFSLRVGRQELEYGSSRLISGREGPNVRQSFDGFRGILRWAGTTLDVLAVEPVETSPEAWDDKADSRQKLSGLYSVLPLPRLPGGHLDVYYLLLSREAGRYDQATAREKRQSIGTRLWGSANGWDYNFEFVFQFGEFGSADIRAWMIASDTGYTFARASLQPRLSLKADAASGDRNPNDSRLGTFSSMFPRAAYFNTSSLVGLANLVDLHPAVDLHPTRRLTLTFDWDFFWRESTRDGFYGPSINLLRSGQKSDARYVGSQPSFRSEWRLGRHWDVTVIYARFIAGPFLTRSGSGRDVDYVAPAVTYKF